MGAVGTAARSTFCWECSGADLREHSSKQKRRGRCWARNQRSGQGGFRAEQRATHGLVLDAHCVTLLEKVIPSLYWQVAD